MAGAAYTTITGDVEVFWGDIVELADKGCAIIGCVVAHKTVQFLGKMEVVDDGNDDLSLCSARMITEKSLKSYK
jgi:hypothetical protein